MVREGLKQNGRAKIWSPPPRRALGLPSLVSPLISSINGRNKRALALSQHRARIYARICAHAISVDCLMP